MSRTNLGAPRAAALALAFAVAACVVGPFGAATARDGLTEPFLQNPDADSVSVVWFTEALGRRHEVRVGPEQRAVAAVSERLENFYEDAGSHLPGRPAAPRDAVEASPEVTPRPVWRHEARVDGLTPGESVSYYTIDTDQSGLSRLSAVYRLQPAPPAGAPLRILLTSDHQAFPMAAANIRKAAEVAPDLDAVFFAGDLVNVPGRASEWFDDARGASFFDVLQGRSTYALERETDEGPSAIVYGGAPILQNAPLFPALGNHEVMGRAEPEKSLNWRYNNPRPRRVAERAYLLAEPLVNPNGDPALRRRWIEDASHNARAYLDIFTLPNDGPAGERYYFTRFGDVALVSLYATRIWRTPASAPEVRGRHQEPLSDLARPDRWGYGAFIFEPISRGSTQYEWLRRVLASDAFKDAPVKVVMLHHPPRGLGGNVVPPFAPPEIDIARGVGGAPAAVRYRYPQAENALIRDVEPLLEDADVDLVLFGHSHVWQRFARDGGMTYLESSNVGNSYGCYVGERRRHAAVFDVENHAPTGDPYGMTPAPPSEFAPQTLEDGSPAPCVASQTLTAFSILDTGRRVVESFVFDTEKPTEPPRLFDRFALD